MSKLSRPVTRLPFLREAAVGELVVGGICIRTGWTVILVVTFLLAGEGVYSLYCQNGVGNLIASSVIKVGIYSTSNANITGGPISAAAVPTSRDFVFSLDDKKCRFPKYFDEKHFRIHYSIQDGSSAFVQPTNWRDDYKMDTGDWDVADVVETLDYAATLRKRADWVGSTKKNITFVHIGKAGGSSINCRLRAVRYWTEFHCDNEGSQRAPAKNQESAISKHVNCYTHMDSGLKCFYLQGGSYLETTDMTITTSLGNDYLVNLRSPLDRIASWFTYEHTENHESVYPDGGYHCGQMMLNSCYRHFEHLTTVGLKGPQPRKNAPLKVGSNLTNKECSQWAWAAVQGTVPADYHNAFNYDWYAHRMLFDKRSNRSYIFALRLEHLEHDWSTIDKLLGGNGAVPSGLTNPQNSAQNKPYVVSDHGTTREGILNLCRALCEEIQLYKQLLTNSINLGQLELKVSMEELKAQCPEEVNLVSRQCR